MTTHGYVVRPEYLSVAIGKARADQVPALEALADTARGLDALERSLPDRLRQARREAGIEMPELSRAAEEAVEMSAAAGKEVHRLLSRRCRRAETAVGVVRELATMARDDLEWDDFDLSAEDEPLRRLMAELREEKRALIAELEGFLAEHATTE